MTFYNFFCFKKTLIYSQKAFRLPPAKIPKFCPIYAMYSKINVYK